MNNTQSLFHLVLVLVFFFTQFPVLSRSCHDNERSALLSFKSSLSYPSNRLSSWQQESRNCCAWHGIQCSHDSFHVVALDLPGIERGIDGKRSKFVSYEPLRCVNLRASHCSIQGSFPTSITKLSQLEVLDLSGNNLTGQLPSSISNLKNLRSLYLHGNKFQGSIPETICEVSSLQELSLDRNNLTGRIPSCITKLRNLSLFSIAQNSVEGNVSLVSYINELNLTQLSLRSNSITVEIDQHLSPSKFQLEVLMLQSCNMKGYIPTFICKFTHLERLDLSHNNLIGDIPFCLFRLPNLDELDLSVNKLQGTLPRSLHYFRELNLSSNNLEGLLPLQSQNFGSFDLSHNSFTGFSIEAGKRLFNGLYVHLSGNKLSGSIPLSLCSSKNEHDKYSWPLYSLDLSNNSLTGTIPSSLSYCVGLKSLNLGMNKLIGNVPNELGRLTSLVYLQLNDNSLNGTFPNFIQRYEDLEILNLGNNNLTGSLPSFIGSLVRLQIVSLRSNMFRGSIPQEIIYLQDLRILDLSRNNLSGTIPKKIGNLTTLTRRTSDPFKVGSFILDVQLQMVIKGIMLRFERLYNYNLGIDLSFNILEGNIPEEIGLLKGLVTLSLSHNRLSGRIPQSVGNMSELQSLDLSFNNLSGDIPQRLTLLDSLGYFNLSYNNLSGRVPRGLHFDTLSGDNGSAYIGNSLLCGFLTEKRCEGDLVPSGSIDVPTSTLKDEDEDDDEDAKEKLLFYGVVILGYGVGFWGLFFVLLMRKEKWWFGYWRLVDIVAAKLVQCVSKYNCTRLCLWFSISFFVFCF